MPKQPAALKHVADAAAQRDRIGRAHVLAFDLDAALIGVDQPVRQPQQRGLARDGAADDGKKLTSRDLERDVVHGLDPAAIKALADMGEDDRGWVLHSGPVSCLRLLPPWR